MGAEALPGKISVKGGACAIALATRPLGAPLTVIFARRDDARRGGRPGQITQRRSSGMPLRPGPPACGVRAS